MAAEVNTPVLDVVCFADLVEKEVSWLANPYIPSGMITIVEGDPECGKTFLAVDMAASITTCRPLLYHSSRPTEPRNVLYMTGEDDLEVTLLPRFNKAGGDKTRFFSIQGTILRTNDKEVRRSITLANIPQIEEGLKTYKPALLVVDPFQAFVGGKIDIYRCNEIRPILDRLGKLAAKYGCAVILIRHLTKAEQKATYKGMGSIDIYAAARSVLLVGKNPLPLEGNEMFDENGAPASNASRYALAHSKCNVGVKGETLAYSIVDGRLKFSGLVHLTPEDILQPLVRKKPRAKAEDFLNEQLADGPRLGSELIESGASLGFSDTTLNRASRQLGVLKRPGGFGKGWLWSLPPASDGEVPASVADNPAVGAVSASSGISVETSAKDKSPAEVLEVQELVSPVTVN